MRISRKLFLRHTIILGVATTLANMLFLWGFFQWQAKPFTVPFILVVTGLLVVNFISGTLFGNYCHFRFRWSHKLVFNSTIYLFPLVGLYIYFILIINERDKELPVFRHIVIGFILSFSVAYFIGQTRTGRPSARIAPNFCPSTQYILKVIDEASFIFHLRNDCDYKKQGQGALECFMKEIRKEFLRYSFTNTGKVLSFVVVAVDISQMKENAVNNPEHIPGINGINSVILLFENYLELSQFPTENAATISAPYGIYLLSGSFEIPLLLLVETSIEYEFRKEVRKRMWALHERLLAKVNKNQKLYSAEQFVTYQQKLNQLSSKMKELYPIDN